MPLNEQDVAQMGKTVTYVLEEVGGLPPRPAK